MIAATIITALFLIAYTIVGIIWLTSKFINRNNPPPPPRYGAIRIMTLEEFINDEEKRHGRED